MLAGSDVIITPSSVTRTDSLRLSYIHLDHVVSSSTTLDFLVNMSEKRKSALPSAIQVKNGRKTNGSEETLHVISRREKGERIVDICSNVTFAHGIVHKIRDNADRIKESAQPGTKVFV
jgi:hypothetical protein